MSFLQERGFVAQEDVSVREQMAAIFTDKRHIPPDDIQFWMLAKAPHRLDMAVMVRAPSGGASHSVVCGELALTWKGRSPSFVETIFQRLKRATSQVEGITIKPLPTSETCTCQMRAVAGNLADELSTVLGHVARSGRQSRMGLEDQTAVVLPMEGIIDAQESAEADGCSELQARRASLPYDPIVCLSSLRARHLTS